MPRNDFKPTAEDRFRTIPESKMVEVLLLAGWAFEVAEGRRAEAVATTTDALDSWIESGLGYRLAADGGRLYDPVEVVNFIKWLGVTGRHPFWKDRFVSTGRRLVMDFRKRGPRTDPVAAYRPNRFQMELRRDFDLSGFAEGSKLRLRAPLPPAGPDLSDLELAPVVSESLATAVSAERERLEVRLATPPSRQVAIGADLQFTATTSNRAFQPLSDDEAGLYLREIEWPVGVTPRVRALAATLAAEATSSWDAVKAFWTYMMDELMYGMVRYTDVPANAVSDWVLDHGWYDCQVGSALLISLCRAIGVPARMVSGYFLYPLAPTHHYWTEVWIDGRGWLPFDFFCWELSEAGRDLAWRDVFAGSIDYRAVSQCFPLIYTGPMSVAFPEAWQMVVSGADAGVEIAYSNITDGSLIYRDRINVENLGRPPETPITSEIGSAT